MNLETFIPIDRRIALSESTELPIKSTGSALFVDISGFTRLSSTFFDEQGKRGAEKITFYLNEIFEVLISRVHSYRGVVIYFSGDAITCWFSGDSGEIALTCALEMQEDMKAFEKIETASSQVSIGIKAMISAGPGYRYLVGDPEIMKMDVIAGPPFELIAQADSIAERGDVLIDANTVKGFEGLVTIKDWKEDSANGSRFAVVEDIERSVKASPWDTPVEISKQELQSWLLPEILERIITESSQFLAELRPAVVIFMKFEGLQYEDNEHSKTQLSEYVHWIQQVVGRYGGSLLQVTVGDKGSNAYLAFGAPVAHQNDSERAVLTALVLQNSSQKFPYIKSVHIGISSGEVYAGAYGSSHRKVYSVLGSQVNLAARLMTVAGGDEILVSERVKKSNHELFEFERQEPVRHKGFSEPVVTFLIRGKKQLEQETSKKSLLRGRVPEKQAIENKLNSLVDGKSDSENTLLIEGDAGIGKSRLIAYLLEIAKERNLEALMGAGTSIERNSAYFVWAHIIERTLELLLVDSPDQESISPSSITSYFESNYPDWVDWVSLLNPYLRFDFPDHESVLQMDIEIQASNRHQMIGRLIDDLHARRPLVIVLEDAQWFDSASWTLFHTLIRAQTQVLFAVTTRPISEPYPAAYNLLLKKPESVFKLDKLDAKSIEQMVCHSLEIKEVPVAISDFMIEKSQGNPLYCEALAFALRDAQFLIIENGTIIDPPDKEELKKLNFPDSINGIILERIDRLKASEQLTLKVASVLGRTFPYKGLQEIYPHTIPDSQLQEELQRLGSLDMTDISPLASVESYFFKHLIIHEVSYNLLLFEQRKNLHKSVAEWYENNYPDDRALYPTLVFHWELAEDKSKTLYYLERAGADALNQYANREAISFLKRAIELSTEINSSVSTLNLAIWNRQIGQGYYYLGEMDNSREYYHSALHLLRKDEPKSNFGVILGIMGQLLRQLSHRYLGLKFVRSNPTLDAKRVEVARIYDLLSVTYLYNGAQERATYAIFFALNTAELAKSKGDEVVSQLSRGYASVGAAFLSVFNMSKLANDYFEKAHSIAEKGNYQPAIGWRYQLGSLLFGLKGEFKRGLDENQIGMSIYEKMGDRRHWEESAHNQALINYSKGQFQDCLDICESHYKSAFDREDNESRLLAVGLQAKAWIELGQTSRAIDHIMELNPNKEATGLGAELLLARGCLALAFWWEGRTDEAFDMATGSAKLLELNPMNFISIYGFSSLAEVGLELLGSGYGSEDQRNELQEIIGNSLAALQKTAKQMSPITIPLADYLKGRNQSLEGNKARAKKLLERSLSKAKELKMPLLIGRIELSLGIHEGSALHLRNAEKLFLELKTPLYLENAQQNLNQLQE